jgi:hypothetical protein
VWTLVEIQVGIIAACAPTIRPVMRNLVQRGIFGTLPSPANSVMSRRSEQSDVQGSVDHTLPRNGSHIKGGVGDMESIHLQEMAGSKAASAE